VSITWSLYKSVFTNDLFDPAVTNTATPITNGTAPSFTANQNPSSINNPNPPLSNTLANPTIEITFACRRRAKSHTPYPIGNASATTSPHNGPSHLSELNLIKMIVGTAILQTKLSSKFSRLGAGVFSNFSGVSGIPRHHWKIQPPPRTKTRKFRRLTHLPTSISSNKQCPPFI